MGVGPDSGIDCWGLDLWSLVGLLCGAFSVDGMLLFGFVEPYSNYCFGVLFLRV